MKQANCLLCYVSLLIVPLGLAVEAKAAASRKDLHKQEPQTSTGHLRRQNPIVALQTAESHHLKVSNVKAATAKKKGRKTLAKRSKSWLNRISKMQQHLDEGVNTVFRRKQRKHRHMKLQEKQTQTAQGAKCRGNKFKWWIKIKKKCVKSYGKGSRWSRDGMDGKCAEAWSECNTGYYAVCCTQPVGAQNMEAYCANKNLTFVDRNSAEADDDKACQVQTDMRGVQDIMTNIKDTIGTIALVNNQPMQNFGPGPGPAPAPAPVMPPSGLVGASPAVGPTLPVTPAPPVDKCAVLMELTRQAAERIHAIKMWAKKDGIKEEHNAGAGEELQQGLDSDSAEAKDPELAVSVKGVIHAGEKLDAMLKNPKFCNPEDESDEDDDDDAQEDLKKDPAEDWDDDDEEAYDDEDDDEEPGINETAIMDLLNWETDMQTAVNKFEKDVHPHGFKWWRYRYEYTIVESFVLAFSMLLLYFVMRLLHGVSFFEVNRFYKTGQTSKLHRYAWAYFVFHAATLMIMVTTAYMLYIPWGEQNIFNWGATIVHDFVDGRANVPFLGYSWLYMILDVQFQLFGCFSLYSLFVVFVVRNYQRALEDWKALSINDEDPSVTAGNKHLYDSLTEIMKKRVQNDPEYRQAFHELKLNLPGVTGLDQAYPNWCEFKLHLYLTDGLGKSVEYLVQVSLTTNLFLACSALVVALLAHHYQVAFMYFLPGFLVISLVLFVLGYFVARHFRKMSAMDDSTPARWVTVHSYCRAIQVMLYCVFFSFSRLLLSNDIFELYPKIYMCSAIGLVVVLAGVFLVAGEAIKETTCALILPPHIPEEQFKNNLQQVVAWHATQNCHECGVLQFPASASYSREWAGNMPSSERKEAMPDSARPYSWRG